MFCTLVPSFGINYVVFWPTKKISWPYRLIFWPALHGKWLFRLLTEDGIWQTLLR
jgi:hypothetical protein